MQNLTRGRLLAAIRAHRSTPSIETRTELRQALLNWLMIRGAHATAAEREQSQRIYFREHASDLLA